MVASKYDSRVLELFQSGRATPAQWAELVAAVGCALDHDLESVAEINRAVGFTAQLNVEEAAPRCRFRGSEDQKMQAIKDHVEAAERKAGRAADRAWQNTLRRLRPKAPTVHTATTGVSA
jgi:hypothetical protein